MIAALWKSAASLFAVASKRLVWNSGCYRAVRRDLIWSVALIVPTRTASDIMTAKSRGIRVPSWCRLSLVPSREDE